MNWLNPFGSVGRQVCGGHATACSLHSSRHGFANHAAVVGFCAAFRQGAQGARQPGVVEDVACLRTAAFNGQFRSVVSLF